MFLELPSETCLVSWCLPENGNADSEFYYSRQTNSTPVPTRRYLRENNIPTSVLTQAAAVVPRVTYDDADPGSDESGVPEGLIVGDGNLKPTVDGTYGTLRKVEVVEGKAVHKVASFAAVIENVGSSPSATQDQQHQRSITKTPSNRDSSSQDNTMLLPVAYSPSEYGGVWENDPNVVCINCTALLGNANNSLGWYAASIQSDATRSSTERRTNARAISEYSWTRIFASCWPF